MFSVHQLLLLVIFATTLSKSYKISSCISNTPCQCYLTQYSFHLSNCSHSLSDLPVFSSKIMDSITKIIARSAFIQWPIHLCKYSNIQILDLSGSYFDSQYVDFSCLHHLIHINLSNTQLNKIPNFKNNHLQILDLSNNHIKIIDGGHFQLLNNLISLFLQNNPVEYIEHLEFVFKLKNLQSINLISSNLDVTLKEYLSTNQWIDIANRWNNSTKAFSIRMINIPFQFIVPKPDQFQLISIDSIKTILKTFINSTFITLFNTPKCRCSLLRTYQRIFSFIDYQKKYSSPLFRSVKCLMADGITHARLFDRRTYIDLRCPLLRKKSFFPFLRSSSSSLSNIFLLLFIVCLYLLY